MPTIDPNDELHKRIANTKDSVKEIPLSQATPLKAKLPQSKGKPVPVKYAHILKLEYVRSFPIIDRLKILFGANLVVMAGIATRHNPGEFQPLIIGRVSNHTSATEHMKHIVENMLEEQVKPSAVQHEKESEK